MTTLPIPQALANADRWLNWRKGNVKADGKFDKIPFDPVTSKAINDKDPATWRPLATCQAHGQLGFAIGDGISMADLDRVRNPHTGAISAGALAIVAQAASYTEISPSGRGIKIFVFGALPHMIKAAIDDTGGTLEIYSEKRFSTFTGQHLDGTPTELANAQLLLDQLAQRYAPPVRERPQRAERSPIIVSSDLVTLRQQALDVVTRLRAGRLDPLTFTALYNQLNKELNPAIKAAVPAAFNAAYTIDQVLEDHGCDLVRPGYYSGVPGDQHGHAISLKVKDGRVFALSPNSRLWNDTAGHDAFSAYTILAHAGNAKQAQAAAADLLAPLAPHAAAPVFTSPEAPEQRRIWAAAKAQQRTQQRDQVAAIHAAIIERANSDSALLNTKGKGTIGFAVLLVLLDSAEGRTWCRLAVATIAQRLDRCVGHVRRGLAQLEQLGYITTERHVNTVTGEIWSGGRNGETPKRTFCDLRSKGIETPQTAETGRSSIFDDDRHDLVTRSHVLKDNNQQARAVLPLSAQPVDLVEQPAVVEPIAIEGGASFDPAAAVPLVERPYTARTKAYLSPHAAWAAVEEAHADYQRTHPMPAPVDQADEPEQQQLVADAPKKRRRSGRARANDPRTLEGQIIALERKAANIARTNPKQSWALRHAADAKRSELAMLAERGDAQLEPPAPTLAEVPQDRARLSVISSAPVECSPTLADLRALARARSAQVRAQERSHA